MLIEGRPLTDLINELPCGEFGKLVRKEIDPLWGRWDSNAELKAYRVVVQYQPYREPEEETVIVEALDEDEANDLARDKAAKEIGRYEDMWVHKIIEIGV